MSGETWPSLLPELGRRTQLVGVLNLTPDSFSDGGRYPTVAAAVEAARALKEAGADLLDVGGETTRPGAEPISAEEELSRVLPVLSRLAAEGLGPVSIDTTKAEVAEAALAAGAHAVNDISGLTFDPEMRPWVGSRGVPVILMHTRAAPKVMQEGHWQYPGGVVRAVRERLEELSRAAMASGLDAERIVIDPGFGFGKTLSENLELLAGLPALVSLGFPVLVGTSRKSFLGQLTGRPVGERVHATAASVACAVLAGAALVRVHDVGEMRDVVRVADAVRDAARSRVDAVVER